MVGNQRRRTNRVFDTIRNESHSQVSAPAVSQPTFLSTFDRESRYPVFIALCDCLSIAEIVSLTQTCKKFSDLYQYLLPIQWDVDKALRYYVDDPQGFRSQMARSDALIAGTFAAQFFERAYWDHGPLDVLVRIGLECELFSKYLSDLAGYSEVGPEECEGGLYNNTFLGEVRVHGVVSIRMSILTHETLLRPRMFTRDSDGKVAIRLNSTFSQPIITGVTQAHFTAEVNVLSWNKAYSVFPLSTFILKMCHLVKSWDEGTTKSARILSRRGLNVQGVMWPEDNRRNHPIRRRRRIDDRYTWKIPFDTRKVQTSKTPDYVLEYACFKVGGLSTDYGDIDHYGEEGDVLNYLVNMEMLESKVLKYSYAYGDEEMLEFFMDRLRASTVLELHKLNAAERPTDHIEILNNPSNIDYGLRDFSPPSSWAYRDDDIPKWYKAFEKHNPELLDSEQMAI